MEYIGENLLIGYIGHFLVVLSFVGALLSAVSYYKASFETVDKTNWLRLGKLSFRLHSIGVIGVVITLFSMLLGRMFEYHYVWHHSNSEMPLRYVFSAFWEGQEGSFLLWSFWHVILGNLLIRTAKEWEAPVMSIFSLIQLFLTSMVLGVYIFGYKLGSNPFALLLREHPDFQDIPLFNDPNYLEKLDGRGLNPLLQNYWMTIHPPTLFLGFASTAVPFCFAVAALWKKKYNDWLKPVIPWTVFGVMVLGVGILMGGAWAYEALSFGGFWAWDPVENASLVPWITLVGALHVMLVQKNKGNSLFTTFLLTIISFILILYSTFLTRSGILGETSVHAFTDLGMSGQLLIYLLSFLILGLGLLIWNAKHFPKDKAEDALWSREFWMFIGSLVLFLAAFQIIFETSKPVINSIFDTNMALSISAADRRAIYHSWQIPLAIVILITIGVSQFLKYKNTDTHSLFKGLLYPTIAALILTAVIVKMMGYANPYYILLMFSALFAVCSNISYFIQVLKGKINKAGSSIAHIGFGLILLGALISTSGSQIISQNYSSIDIEQLGEEFDNRENILLFKNDTVQMGEYLVTYNGRKKEGINILYEIEYFKQQEDLSLASLFKLKPRVQLNPRMGNVAEPDTRHFLTRDVYTHVTYAELEEDLHDHEHEDGYEEPKTQKVAVGDTLFSSNAIITLDSIVKENDLSQFNLNASDIAVSARLTARDLNGKAYTAAPMYIIKDTSIVYTFPAEIEELGVKLDFQKIIPDENKVEIALAEKESNAREFIIMKAIVFPFINILWIGCILMAVGTIIAIVNRVQKK